MDQARRGQSISQCSIAVQADLALLSTLDMTDRGHRAGYNPMVPVVPNNRNKPPIRAPSGMPPPAANRRQHSRAIIVRCSALNNAATHTHRNGSAHSPGKNRHQEPNGSLASDPNTRHAPPTTNPCSMAFIDRLISGLETRSMSSSRSPRQMR